jgi:hypothetical protein
MLRSFRWVFGTIAYRDKKELSVSLCVFRAPLHYPIAGTTRGVIEKFDGVGDFEALFF